MNWIQTIIHKITNYDTVVKENNSLRTKEAEVEKQLGNVLEQLTTINNKYSLLKEELQKLTSKKILNINKLKNYYEGKRIPEAWVYNGGRLGSKDVKYYLRIATKDQPVIAEASKTLIKKYHPKTSQEIVASLLKYFSSTRQWTYTYDKEQFGKNEYWQKSDKSWETRRGDCLIWNTKLLNENFKYINIEDVEVGDKIVGKDGNFVIVKNKWDKGILSTKKLLLSNGSEIIATDEHKFILEDDSEILCKDLKLGDSLKELKNLHAVSSKDLYDEDYYYLLGLFVADGWADHSKKRISISGKDGHPKEKQKEWVKQYCESKGLKYYWNERYILIHSEELYYDFKNNGTHAINKHINEVPNEKENIEALLKGLQADAHIDKKGIITYGTISTLLKNDILMLYKKLGIGCHTRLWEPCETQFGKNPIWRIIPHIKRHKKITIKGIIEWKEEHVYDIEVEDHEIFLPENGVVVHNCDDLAILMNGLYEETCNQLGLQDDVWRLTFTAGTLNTGGGHAYNTYLADDGEYYAVESTFDIKGSYHRTWLKTPIKNNNFYSKFWGFATKKQSWKGNLEALQIEINEE